MSGLLAGVVQTSGATVLLEYGTGAAMPGSPARRDATGLPWRMQGSPVSP